MKKVLKLLLSIISLLFIIFFIYLYLSGTYRLHSELLHGPDWFPRGYWRHIAVYEMSKMERIGKKINIYQNQNEILSNFGKDAWGKQYKIFIYKFNDASANSYQEDLVIISSGKNQKLDGDYTNFETFINNDHDDDIIINIYFWNNKNVLQINKTERKYYHVNNKREWIYMTIYDIFTIIKMKL